MLALFGRRIVGLDFEWRRLASWRQTLLINRQRRCFGTAVFLCIRMYELGPACVKTSGLRQGRFAVAKGIR